MPIITRLTRFIANLARRGLRTTVTGKRMNEDERDRLLRVKLEALILARLSVSGQRPPSIAQVSRTLHGMLARRFTGSEWRQCYATALGSLCDEQLIRPKPLALTRAGKARLMAALGLDSAPRAKSWTEFKVKYLPRLFFPEQRSGRWAIEPHAALLAERLGVRVSLPGTAQPERRRIEGVIEAWLRQELQLKGPVNLATVAAALLGRELGLRSRQTPGDVLRQSLALLSGATQPGPDAVIDALAERWLFGERTQGASKNGSSDGTHAPRRALTERKTATGDPDRHHRAFLTRAASKIACAASSPTARAFGSNKVFIASVWESLAADPELHSLGEAGFKALLVDAHRQGLIALSRADLVAAMDPRDVAASETRHRNATYHFISRGQLEGHREGQQHE
jgi:hypothetical protein